MMNGELIIFTKIILTPMFDFEIGGLLPWTVLHSTALRQKCHTSTLFQELDDFLPTVWNKIGKQCLLLSILLDKTCRQQSRNSSFPLILPEKLNRIIDNQSLTVIEIYSGKKDESISMVMSLPGCRICYAVLGKEKRCHREAGIDQIYAAWSCKEHMVPGSFCWKHNSIKWRSLFHHFQCYIHLPSAK